MTFLDFIFTRAFWKNLLWIIIVGIGLALIALFILKTYTRHGTTFEMPDYRGMMPDEIQNLPISDKFRFEVIDTIFSDDLVRGSIAAQDPAPGSLVKSNRKVFLTLVSDVPEQVEMPNLKNLTLRMAAARLETYGLRLGQRVFVPSQDANVIAQLYRGQPIEPGTEIPKGSTIDLQIGQGNDYENVSIPLLIGMLRTEAVAALVQAGLSIGNESFDSSTDTSRVRIYRQYPGPDSGTRVPVGSPVDVWYKSGTIEEFEALKNQYLNETEHSEDNFDF